MSWYYLLASILIAMIAVFYVWYASRSFRHIPDDEPLLLHTDEDKLATMWYEQNIKQIIDFNVNEIEVATRYLKQIHELEVDPDFVVIGEDLQSRYHRITGKYLELKYDAVKDCIFDIRSSIGKKGEIAIIYNKKLALQMRQYHTLDIAELNAIISQGFDILVRDFFRKILDSRWEKLRELNDPNLTNSHGSYAYVKMKVDIPLDTVTLYGNVTAVVLPQNRSIARINLLCKDLEFETLLKRWRASMNSTVEIPLSIDT